MKITRRQLRRLISETIYAGPPSPSLEKTDGGEGITLKTNLAITSRDEDGEVKIEPQHAPIVGRDSAGLESSLSNIAKGVGETPELSENFAKIIALFSGGANNIMSGDLQGGVETFNQAWAFVDTLGISMNLNTVQLTVFLDAMSGAVTYSDVDGRVVRYADHQADIERRGNTIDPKVFYAFRSSLLFGQNVSRADEIAAIKNSQKTVDPLFNNIQTALHRKLFPLFINGYIDAATTGNTASLNQFVSLGLTNYPDNSLENFMIQILIAPYEIYRDSSNSFAFGSWDGIDYVNNELITLMFGSAASIKSTQHDWSYVRGKVKPIGDKDMTGSSSITLPDASPKVVNPEDWGKKRRYVDYIVKVDIPKEAIFGGESLEDLMRDLSIRVFGDYDYSDTVISYFDNADDDYKDQLANLDHEAYEASIINTVYYNMLTAPNKLEASLNKALAGLPVSDLKINEDRTGFTLKYSDSAEGGIAPSDIVDAIKTADIFKFNTHNNANAIGIDLLEEMFYVIDEYRSNHMHVPESLDAEYYDDYNPVNHVEFSWTIPNQDLEGSMYAAEKNPALLRQMAADMKPHKVDISDKLDITVLAQNKSADKLKSIQKESISARKLKMLIRGVLRGKL